MARWFCNRSQKSYTRSQGRVFKRYSAFSRAAMLCELVYSCGGTRLSRCNSSATAGQPSIYSFRMPSLSRWSSPTRASWGKSSSTGATSRRFRAENGIGTSVSVGVATWIFLFYPSAGVHPGLCNQRQRRRAWASALRGPFRLRRTADFSLRRRWRSGCGRNDNVDQRDAAT
jgi:hypothetical protein